MFKAIALLINKDFKNFSLYAQFYKLKVRLKVRYGLSVVVIASSLISYQTQNLLKSTKISLICNF